MKKALGIVIVMSMAFMLIFPQEGACQKENLYAKLWDVQEIRVYVVDPTDSSGAAGDMLKGIKRELEDALEGRQTLNFKIVRSENDADFIITTDIVERVWADHDPIDSDHLPPGYASWVIDAARDDDYGRIQAIMTVKEGPNSNIHSELGRFRSRTIIWGREVSADVTEPKMTEEESKPILEKELAKVFIRKCLSKNSKM
ncbi:MAG: hypothetical protein WBD24_03355 [Candidatus Omnitrophota bacterium]